MSNIGKPYDPKTGTGVIGKNYAYQVLKGAAVGFYEDKEFNLFAGAGALGMCIDDFNGDNFDHKDLNFIHGANISYSQTGARPIQNNVVPPGTPTWGKDFKAASIKYANRHLNVGAQGSCMPFRHHYLDLDPTYKDEFGDPLMRITFDFEDQDRELVKFMGAKCGEILKEMGADKVVANTKLAPYEITTYQSTHNTAWASSWEAVPTPPPSTITCRCGTSTTCSSSARPLSRITAATTLRAPWARWRTGPPKGLSNTTKSREVLYNTFNSRPRGSSGSGGGFCVQGTLVFGRTTAQWPMSGSPRGLKIFAGNRLKMIQCFHIGFAKVL